MEKYATYKKKKEGYVDVHETVKTIEKIAAAHLHEIDKRARALSRYGESIVGTMARLQNLTAYLSLAKKAEVPKRDLLVVVTGDKGLVGDAWRRLFSLYDESNRQDVLVIGKQGQRYIPATLAHVRHHSFSDRLPSSEEISVLNQTLRTYIENGTYATITTLHLSAESVIDLKPVKKQLLPLFEGDVPTQEADRVVSGYPIVEGSIFSIKEKLLEKYMNSRLEQTIIETAVAEYSARTIAMEHAAAKTEEMLARLSLVYLRDRRHSETEKQLERFAANKIST